jgi:hypothetical protein
MKLPYDQDDLDAAALCAWREERSNGIEGMRVVLHNIALRAERWYGATSEAIHTAIFAKNQFSSMSRSSDPQFHLLPAAVDQRYKQALALAPEVFDGIDPDVTNGALYYANLASIDQGGWFARHIVGDPAQHPEVAKIRDITCYA